MTNILVYDTDAEVLESMAEANDMTTADMIDMLMEYLEEMKISNKLQ